MHVTTQGANDLLTAFVEQMRDRIGSIDDAITRQLAKNESDMIVRAENYLRDIGEQEAKYIEKMALLSEECANLRAQYTVIASDNARLKRMSELSSKLLNIAGNDIRTLRAAIDQSSAEIAAKDDMLNRADVEIEQLRGAIDDMTTRLAEAEANAGEKIAASIAESIAAFFNAK